MLAAEAKKADFAREDTLLIPRPPSFNGLKPVIVGKIRIEYKADRRSEKFVKLK